MTVGRKRQTKLQSSAAVVTQKTFNSVWFPLFKGVLWSGCAGYNRCLKLSLRCNLIVPWGKKKLELKISVMSHVHGRELTEGMWVGKANLNFIDWTEQKYQALNHSWGVVERCECVFPCLLSSSLQFQRCCLFTLSVYLLVSELRWLDFWIFLKMHLFIKMDIFVSKLEGDGMSVKLRERQSSVTVPYTLLVVFENVCQR